MDQATVIPCVSSDYAPPEEAVLWLQVLRRKTTKIVWFDDCRDGFFKGTECTRCLTVEEFTHFCEVAPHFIVEPTIAEGGFSFGISLYIEHPAICPGIDPECEYVITISGEYLPEEIGQRFEHAWKVLSPLSHCDANREKLSRNGREPPREKSYYEY